MAAAAASIGCGDDPQLQQQPLRLSAQAGRGIDLAIGEGDVCPGREDRDAHLGIGDLRELGLEAVEHLARFRASAAIAAHDADQWLTPRSPRRSTHSPSDIELVGHRLHPVPLAQGNRASQALPPR